MKLYPIPGGDWAGTEADWKAKMKARGLDPKNFEATKTREVPTGKKELMEFLTFFAVDVYCTGDTAVVTGAAPVDVEALRSQFNPDPAVETPAASTDFPIDLDEVFAVAPLGQQLRLAVVAIDAAHAKLNKGM